MKDKVEYIVRDHHVNINANIVSVGQMKRLINFSKGCILMVVRAKDAKAYETFQDCDLAHKK